MVRLITIAAALAASACAPEAAGPANNTLAEAPAATTKACDLLTPEDAKNALGREVKRLDNGRGSSDTCRYGYGGLDVGIAESGVVSVTIMPVAIGSEVARARAEGFELEPISGIGDEAYYSREIGLNVGKGSRTARYMLTAGGLKDAKERSIALARATAGRL